VRFSHRSFSPTVFEGYVGLSVPHVSAFAQRFSVFSRVLIIPVDSCRYCRAIGGYFGKGNGWFLTRQTQLISQPNQQGKKPQKGEVKKPLIDPFMYLSKEPSEPVESV